MKKQLIIAVIVIVFVIIYWEIKSQTFNTQRLNSDAQLDNTSSSSREGLSSLAIDVMFHSGTERPFSSQLLNEHRKGIFVSADTGLPLFRSEDKFDSGTGWPSFTQAISVNNIVLHQDDSFGYSRVSVATKDSGAHLGHVFDDGPLPLGKRWCINGVALRFVPD